MPIVYFSIMAANTFGIRFRVTTFGESHGTAIGAVIDGCPAGLPLTVDDIQPALDARRPGQSAITTPRSERDRVEILSGVFESQTLGTPIALLIRNADAKSRDYDHLKDSFRPGHADFTYEQRYGRRDHRGGGRSSARETAARVAAGAVAEAMLRAAHPDLVLRSHVHRVADIAVPEDASLDWATLDHTPVRCPHPPTADRMVAAIEAARDAGDTLGGVVRATAEHVPAGWGNPVFDKLEARLAHAMLSLPAVKSFEVGSGLDGTFMRGSEHNDVFARDGDRTITTTNRSGGIQGGISNGMPIDLRIGFKPVSTIMRDQPGVDREGRPITIEGKGRHDPCVLPRAVPIVRAMLALVLADAMLDARGAQL